MSTALLWVAYLHYNIIISRLIRRDKLSESVRLTSLIRTARHWLFFFWGSKGAENLYTLLMVRPYTDI